MAVEVVMPQMGESIFEGTVTKWLKKPGDRVRRDEPLLEISTDKVDAEIQSPASGVLTEIKVSEGQTVPIRTVLALIDAEAPGKGAGEIGAETPDGGTETKPALSKESAGAPAPDRVELGRGVEPRLVRLHDPQQPVAVEVAVARQPVHLGADPRLGGRVADGDPPGPGEKRRLDRLGLERVARGDVVEGIAGEADRAVPEDRVADEPVVPLRGQQRLELGPGALGGEAPPADRGEAGVPVPLPRIPPRARPRVRECSPVARALQPARSQHLLRGRRA